METNIRVNTYKCGERKPRIESEALFFTLTFIELFVQTMHGITDKNLSEIKGKIVEPEK